MVPSHRPPPLLATAAAAAALIIVCHYNTTSPTWSRFFCHLVQLAAVFIIVSAFRRRSNINSSHVSILVFGCRRRCLVGIKSVLLNKIECCLEQVVDKNALLCLFSPFFFFFFFFFLFVFVLDRREWDVFWPFFLSSFDQDLIKIVVVAATAELSQSLFKKVSAFCCSFWQNEQSEKRKVYAEWKELFCLVLSNTIYYKKDEKMKNVQMENGCSNSY